MGDDHEGRALTGRSDKSWVARRMEQGVCGSPTAGREADRFGDRGECRVHHDATCPTEDPGHGERVRIEPRHDRWFARRASDGHDPGWTSDEALELRVRRLDLADEVARSDVDKVIATVVPGNGGDRSFRGERVRRPPEDPGRIGELRGYRSECVEGRAVEQPVQVPPARSIRDEMDDAVGGPLRLGDRLFGAARDQDRLAQRAIRVDRGHPEATGVPGHVRVVPLQPGDTTAARGDPGRGQEVGAEQQHRRRLQAVDRDRNDRGHRLPVVAVVLPDGQEPPARGIGPQVGISPLTFGRDCHGRIRTRIDPVEPSVGEVREHHDPAGHDIGAAAVLVDPGADIEGRRGHIGDGPVHGRSDQHATAALGRAPFEPVDVVAIDPDLGETDGIADDIVDPDRRDPGSKRRDGRRARLGDVRLVWPQRPFGSLDHVPWRHEAT